MCGGTTRSSELSAAKQVARSTRLEPHGWSLEERDYIATEFLCGAGAVVIFAENTARALRQSVLDRFVGESGPSVRDEVRRSRALLQALAP